MAKVDDIRVKVGWFDSRKCKRLQAQLKDKGVICLMRLWCRVATERSRGVLYDMDNTDIAAEAGWPEKDADRFVNTLINLKLIDRTDDGLVMHEWPEHQGWAYETEDRSRKASNNANKRWGSNANSNAHSNTTSNAKSESSNAPIPSLPNLTYPIPSLPKEKAFQLMAAKILGHLNSLTGKTYRVKTKDTQNKIRARLKDGFTFEDFVHVHEVKAAQWLGDPKWEHNLCPKTLYADCHFDNYLNQRKLSDIDKLSERVRGKIAAGLRYVANLKDDDDGTDDTKQVVADDGVS